MKKYILLSLLSFVLISLTAQNKVYEPSWESLRTRPYPQWFKDAKLGIFIHWSLSSVPAWSGKEQYAEWFLRGIMTGDTARIRFQERVFGKNFRYEDYAPLFKAELFDPKEWADLFRDAGAKYVVFVSKHHDGFCLWPSRYSPGWNSMETGPHRDIVGELSRSVREDRLRMGLYYSLPEWNNSLYRWGTDPADKVHAYVDQHMIPQFKELVSTYKPSLIFSDGEWDHPASTWHAAELISWYYNLAGDEAIVNDRWGSGSDGIGFRTPEYSSGLVNSDRPWAEVRGLGRSFGLNRNESLDAYMTPGDLVHFFVKAVANGGGMILNVGPYCDGQIPLLQQERLLQLGSWLKVNGEAIYGSESYKRTEELKDVTLERVDPGINFDWVRNSPGKPIVEDHFTAEWSGYLKPRFTEEYLFEASADDGIRVWIDGQLLVDKWTAEQQQTQSNVMEAGKEKALAGKIRLQAGKLYFIRAEYHEETLNASASLWWSSKNQSREIVPCTCFFTADDRGSSNGLKAKITSKATSLCYTRNKGNLYAIALDWPEDNKLILRTDAPETGTKIALIGRNGDLPWQYSDGNLIIDLSPVKITELPCEWAWTFRIEGMGR